MLTAVELVRVAKDLQDAEDKGEVMKLFSVYNDVCGYLVRNALDLEDAIEKAKMYAIDKYGSEWCDVKWSGELLSNDDVIEDRDVF